MLLPVAVPEVILAVLRFVVFGSLLLAVVVALSVELSVALAVALAVDLAVSVAVVDGASTSCALKLLVLLPP